MTTYIEKMFDGADEETLAELKDFLKFINDTPLVLSLCYDLNLMPETIDNAHDFLKLLSIAQHMKTALLTKPDA